MNSGKFAQGLVGAEGAWGRFEFDPLGFSTSFRWSSRGRTTQLHTVVTLVYVGP